MYPDVGGLGAKIMQSRGREELKKAIFKGVDKDDEPDSEVLKDPVSAPKK
jgi:hypothetical protein